MKKFIVVLLFALVVSGLFAAQPRTVVFSVTVDEIPLAGTETISVQYWMVERPTEIGTAWSYMAPFTGVSTDLQYFDTPWAIGETFHCEVTVDGNMDFGEVVITELSGAPMFPPVTPTITIEGGVVPVTLSGFSAAVFENQFVEISWTTETESGNQGFYIYRGTTDDLATSVQLNYDLISGAGSSTEPLNYSYMDESVEDNTIYWYWLESVSNDETYTHDPITLTVDFDEDPIEIIPEATKLFGNHPNPFNPLTVIKFDVKEGETAKITIFDIKGRIVESATYGQGEQTHTWEANSSASGVYFYKLQSESHTSVKKMMLLK
jgi:hypothetical protein